MDVNKRLQQACIRGDFKEIDAALAEGANINAIVDGYAILSGTIIFRQLEVAKYLCDKGADVNARPKGGYAPVDYAEMYLPEIVGLLRKKGASTIWGLDD